MTTFYKEMKFKETPIGEIPRDWRVVKVEDLGEVITGTTPSTTAKEYWNGKYPFVTPTDITQSEYVKKTERKITEKGLQKGRVIPKDSVLVTCIASIGKIALASEPCITNQQINAIICKQKVDPHYVYYAMTFRSNILRTWAGRTTNPIVKKSLFEKFPLSLPENINEQQKIASTLSTVDEAIQKVDVVLTKTERLKKGLMHELLTKGIGHKEFKQTEIERIPKDWEVDTLPNLMNIIDYRGRTPPFSESGIPYVGSDNIRNERIVFDNRRYVSEEAYNQYMTRGIPNPGDILFTTEAPLGEVAIIPRNFKFCFAQRLVALQCKNNFESTFFMYMLRSKTVQKQLRGWATGTTVKGISSKNMKFIKIPYSKDVTEQQKIAEIISTADKKLELERNEKMKLKRIKQGLMDLLLSGKIRVRVD